MQALHPNPDPGSSESPSVRALECKIEMVFRFWTPSSKSQDLTQQEAMLNKHPGVLALIEDVVASKSGTFLVGDQQLYVSGLKHPADALVISRQLQLCMQGFRERQGTAPVAVSIAIDARGKTAVPANPEADGNGDATLILRDNTAGPSYDLVTLLQLSRPAQILLTHDLCDQVRGLKWLPLKSFPDRFGVFEYLWAAEEKLEQVQSEAPFKLPELLPSPTPESARPEVVADEAAFAGRQSIAGHNPLEEESVVSRLLTALRANRMIAIAVAVLVVTVAGVRVASKLTSTPAMPAVKVADPGAPITQANPKPIPPTSSSGAIPANKIISSDPPAPPHSKDKAPTASPDTSASTQNAPNAAVTNVPVPRGGCGLTGGLGSYLAIAEDKRGKADYAGAEHIYRQVLQCDPTNAAAKSGLERTRAAEQE